MIYKKVLLLLILPTQYLFADITHIVSKGESLMAISNIYYGTHQCHHLIYQNNKKTMKSMNDLEIGQRLNISLSAKCRKKRVDEVTKEKVRGLKLFKFDKKLSQKKSTQKKITYPKPPEDKVYAIQLKAFKNLEEAMSYKKAFAKRKEQIIIEKAKVRNEYWYRVMLGPYRSRKSAKEIHHNIVLHIYPDSYVKKLDLNNVSDKSTVMRYDSKYSKEILEKLRLDAIERFKKIQY